ncbi:hypothetical protein PR048_030737 [Dryococelus australis]|uniref:Serine aminopeptidase S33 domain-containing protein n=1 Tax=Dryococelus australis TaxID=614101 RepID=A0ABQ9G9R8_9NEOP|nr:hypothetical protein PR048_030737 [Dryococelus australis]
MRVKRGGYVAVQECEGEKKREIPEDTRQPAVSSGTISTTGVNQLGYCRWHEMGVWDVPAMLEYVRLSRGDMEPLRYVGHSMGGTALLVACAERPQACSMLSGAVLLAPGAFLASSRSPLVHSVMRFHDRLWVNANHLSAPNSAPPKHNSVQKCKTLSVYPQDTFYLTGQYECMTHNRRLSGTIRMCDYNILIRKMCEAIYDDTLARAYFGINETHALTFFAHIPTGTSIYTVDHYTQIIKSGKIFTCGTTFPIASALLRTGYPAEGFPHFLPQDNQPAEGFPHFLPQDNQPAEGFPHLLPQGKFQHYDSSISGRINKKSTAKVPEYNLTKVTIPIALYYSKGDTFVDAEFCCISVLQGVLELSCKLPNVVTLHEVADPNFDHFSFIAGNNVRDLLYDKILASLRAL